jgi:Rad51
MVQNLNPNEIYQFIVSDFRGAWDSIAGNYNQSIGRGNFMFPFQAMNLLEFASRLCANNSKLLNNFSNEINRIDPKYFTLFPGPCGPSLSFLILLIIKVIHCCVRFSILLETGKTQLCYTLCVTLASHYRAIYIDTESSFRPERIKAIARARDLDHEKILQRILVAKALDSTMQESCIREAGSNINVETSC